MFISIVNSLMLLSSFIYSQDCLLQVPNDPLNTGLFKPWFLSTNPISQLPCSQAIIGSEVFVEATIFDITNNSFFVYNPLVVDMGTVPAIPINVGALPQNNIVVIHIGSNGNSVTLTPTIDINNINSLFNGNCINGLVNSVFGQVAYCNAFNFFNQVNQNINNGLLIIPPIGNTILGDICPTIRSFSVVDQDQSDNVITQYILTTNNIVAQDTDANRAILNILRILTNGSDNRLLEKFIDVAVGCKPFTAADLIDPCCTFRTSMALNEIQANLNSPALITTALVPSIDPMTLLNGMQCLQKTNLYRIGVNQPPLAALNDTINMNYCTQMSIKAVEFFILHQNELLNTPSPVNNANNLLNFLANRFFNSWTNLNCQILTGLPSPITVTIVNNTVISNNLIANITTAIPTTIPTTVPTTIPTTIPTSIPTIIPTTIPTQTLSTSINWYTTISNIPVITTSGIFPGTLPMTTMATSSYNVNITSSGAPTTSGSNTTSNGTPTMTSSNMTSSSAITTPTTSITSIPMINITDIPMINITYVCGISINNVNCSMPCFNGLNSDCISANFTCFNVTNMCNVTTPLIPKITNLSTKISINLYFVFFALFIYCLCLV